MDKQLVNRVAKSGLITLNLETYYPSEELVSFDIADYLFQKLILREKEFRKQLRSHDWTQYKNKILIVECSVDAIIPIWAYMLIASYASDYVSHIFQGSREDFLRYHFRNKIQNMNLDHYKDKRVVIKGCSEKDVPTSAYLEISQQLKPVVQSLMFGEPCSTVPIFKRPKTI